MGSSQDLRHFCRQIVKDGIGMGIGLGNERLC